MKSKELTITSPKSVKRLKNILQLLIISGFVILTSVCQASSRIPVIHVAAENLTPLDIGLVIGQQSKKLFVDIERRYDHYLMGRFSQMGFDDILRNRFPSLKNAIDNRYQKELEGVASAWTLVHKNKLGDGYLSWDEFWVLNLLPDIGVSFDGLGFGVLSALSREKGTIIGRNLELKNNSRLRGLQALTLYQYADHSVVNIGFAGVISVLSGFNDDGLFVAHLNASSDLSMQNPSRAKTNTEKSLQSHGFVLREVLESMSSVAMATKALEINTYSTSSNTLIGDQENIQVVEFSTSGKTKVRSWNSQTRNDKHWSRASQIATVSCHVLPQMSGGCPKAKDIYRWERLHALAVFTKDNLAGTQDVAGIMLDTHNQYFEIMGVDTLQSMIFLPATGHLYFYAAPVTDGGTPPVYQVYHLNLLATTSHDRPEKDYAIWWVTGLLLGLAIMLLMLRRTIKQKSRQVKSVG